MMAAVMMDILVEGERVTDIDDRFLRVSPSRATSSSSAPHSRSSSFKNRPRPKLSQEVEDAVHQRPRTNSLPFLELPCPPWMSHQPPDSPGGVRRVRSFKTTSKGTIVNRGDSFKRSTHSLHASSGSLGSIDQSSGTQGHVNQGQGQGQEESQGGQVTSSSSTPRHTPPGRRRHRHHHSQGSLTDVGSSLSAEVPSVSLTPSFYRVLMVGSTGSGKSSLTRQFMTSEYSGTYEISTPDDVETDGMAVTVQLDGEESMVQFIDEEMHLDHDIGDIKVDGYVVVFSLTDQASYDYAVSAVRQLRVTSGVDRAVILVGNKSDLVRQRRVSKDDASRLAAKYDCGYAETSAALNVKVDEVLVAVLSQIRIKLHPPDPALLVPADEAPRPRARSKSPGRTALNFFQRLFRHGSSTRNKYNAPDVPLGK